jgi:hypothetical protein
MSATLVVGGLVFFSGKRIEERHPSTHELADYVGE